MSPKNISKRSQDASDIVVLRGLEPVWQNPARYIGDTNIRGLHHLFTEIVDNSIDEAMEGTCDRIDVILHEDNSITVKDNGRGIPIDIHPTEKIPAVTVVLTTLDSGGKMNRKAYEFSGGLHGVGCSVVNALSEHLEVIVERDGKMVYQEFVRGKPKAKLKNLKSSKNHGTTIRFRPDNKFFRNLQFKSSILMARLNELAYLHPGLKLTFLDEGSGEKSEYMYPDGISGFVKEITPDPIHPDPIYFEGDITGEEESHRIVYQISFQYNDTIQERVRSYVNSIYTVDGGMHEAGFKSALTACLKDIANKAKIKDEFEGEHLREGLSAVISVKVPHAQFEAQTKTKLTNHWIKPVLQKELTKPQQKDLQLHVHRRAAIHGAL